MLRRLLLSTNASILQRYYPKGIETKLKTDKPHSILSLYSRRRNNLYSQLEPVSFSTWPSYSSILQTQDKLYLFPGKGKVFCGIHKSFRHFSEQVGSDETTKFATGSSLGSSSPAAGSKVDWRVKVRRAQRKRLYYLLGGVAALATLVYSALFAFEDNLMYFLTPTQTLAKLATFGPERRFRLGGVVVNGSFMLNEKEKFAEFVVTDLENEIPVLFKGDTFPDLFGEGKSVVAEGYLRDGIFYADKILAKHDEYYIPKSIQESIQRNPVSVYGALKSSNVGSRSY